MRFRIGKGAKSGVVALALIVSAGVASMEGKAKHGSLRVEGTHLLGETGEPVILRGVSFGWSAWWPRFYNRGSVEWLAEDWKADVVRAAVSLNFDPPEDSYLDKPEETIRMVGEVVEGAIENEIYVIIDWHSHRILLEEAKAFFTMMATRYGEYPNVIYEIYNEPIDDSWEEVKAYSQEVIAAIRAIDPDNLILVGSPHWDQDIHIAADDPLEGVSNVMYTLHYYAASHHDYLLDRANYALEKGLPLFISECAGMFANGDGAIDYDWWNRWIDWSEENKVSYLKWSIADKDETCSMLLPSAADDGGWKLSELKESGRAVRALLREKAGADSP